MAILYLILLLFFLVLGWLLVFFALPGTIVILAASGLYALVADFHDLSDQKVLVILALLTVLAEGTEQAIVFFRSRQQQVPNDVIFSGIVGGILGALMGVPIPVVGSLLGLALGIFCGCFLYAYWKLRNWSTAFRMAKSALISQAIATTAKAIIALGMVVFVIFQLF